jgi:hypothetical protein
MPRAGPDVPATGATPAFRASAIAASPAVATKQVTSRPARAIAKQSSRLKVLRPPCPESHSVPTRRKRLLVKSGRFYRSREGMDSVLVKSRESSMFSTSMLLGTRARPRAPAALS